MPIFKIPPVGPEDDGGEIHEGIREMFVNRNYSPQARFGAGHAPWGGEGRDLPRRGTGLWRRIRSLFRR